MSTALLALQSLFMLAVVVRFWLSEKRVDTLERQCLALFKVHTVRLDALAAAEEARTDDGK